eukprot:CAMPEP_0181311698 /NCGR_PEP_ID=MMETSP1101-20121128/13286_1 /TAXON_ID=46948 /ORGANISM="Rhodomonas abbreviata, Strain Caron Lab Isolate" /LENGTH=303 /DNA_ID=CAMNT_0023418467 /DNA_START=101 /DNA_END=1012 /DNA_ORIENTATION=+
MQVRCDVPYAERLQSPRRSRKSFRNGVLSAVIFPRRKMGQSRRHDDGKPVSVTLEMIHAISDAPLPCAAKKLGISPTALKKACRTLGISRWPYTRQSGGKSISSPHDSNDDDGSAPETLEEHAAMTCDASSHVQPVPSITVVKQEDRKNATAGFRHCRVPALPSLQTQQSFSCLFAGPRYEDPFAENDFETVRLLQPNHEACDLHEKAEQKQDQAPEFDDVHSEAILATETLSSAACEEKGIEDGENTEANLRHEMTMAEHCLQHAQLARSAMLWVRHLSEDSLQDSEEEQPTWGNPTCSFTA